jgi:uncharacterized protein YqjF (DUF2071 family)
MQATAPGTALPRRVQGRPLVLTQRWADIVWAHWRVPVEEIRALLPDSVEVDTFDGSAWVGLVPFEMQDLRVVARGRRLPGLGSTRSFSEVNVRTYVTGPLGPGVWFHTLDATSRLAVAVARGAWALPYRAARIRSERSDGRRAWTVARRDGTTGVLDATLGPEVGTTPLDEFLTARFRLYAPLGRSRLLSAPVAHAPWSLRQATVERIDPGRVAAAGSRRPGVPDHVVAAAPVEVAIGLPALLRAGRAGHTGHTGHTGPD